MIEKAFHMIIYGDKESNSIGRSEQTKQRYLNRSRQLIARARKELGIRDSEDLDVRQLAIWLSEHKRNINSKSWRQYKSSVIYFLETCQDELAAEEAIEYLRNQDSSGSKTKTDKTSSMKLKKITIEDWTKLESFFTERGNKWHDELKFWLRSSIITGLRPTEWKNAVFCSYEGKPALKIQNAKNTNGRANGPIRTLVLENVSKEDLAVIKTHLNNVRTFAGMGEYDFFYQGCAVALYKACRKCWPRRKRHITLYSTRHQFSANAKSSGMSRTEVAALMGHAVDETAGEHYGRKQAGNERIGVSPIESEVDSVRRVTIDDFQKGKNANLGEST